MDQDVGADLFWLPLGAGGRVVRWNGRLYEAVSARRRGRPRTDLYHSALRISLPEDWWVVEMEPAFTAAAGTDRGVVAVGAVGAGWAGRSRWFRYEVHCCRGGSIPNVGDSVASPVRITSDASASRRLLAVLPSVPAPVWGRDELGTGEMWNSNSVIAWALARAGLPASDVRPPEGGSAPGWGAGAVTAQRQLERTVTSSR